MITTPTTRATIIAGAVAGASALLLATVYTTTVDHRAHTTDTALHDSTESLDFLEEDELGWNCATMGNRQCGPDFTDPANWCHLIGDIITCPDWQRLDILYPVL